MIEEENYYLIEGVFPPFITAGFTKRNAPVGLGSNLENTYPFLNKEFKISYLNQLHSSKVNFVEKSGLYEGDGLFSAADNLALVVKTADCLPVFFYSSKYDTIGIVHMGWRSAKEGILDNINFDISSFKVTVGVGLRPCCYSVGKEFSTDKNLKSLLHTREGQLYFDPVGFVKDILGRRGLRKENFFDVNICSFCSKGPFFSYRKAATSQRTLSFIIKEKFECNL